MKPRPRLGSESIVLQATRDNPVYLIQAHRTGEVRDGVRILLGKALDTVFLGVGRHDPRRNALKLHIRTDALHGARYKNSTAPDPYDFAGGINRSRDLIERVILTNRIAFGAKEAPGKKRIEIFDINPSKPTLIVGREGLCHVDVAPELRGKTADPFFEKPERPMRLIDHDFERLVDAVRKTLPCDRYLLID